MSRRGALIGCGFFAQNQLHSWAEIEGAEIVAICDREAGRLTTTGERFGIGARYGYLEQSRSPETSGEDSLKTLQLVDAAYESARSGDTLHLHAGKRP
jgi:predicted dehydrogenase